eukprot:15479965-Alexandrium_andersonii.AAC.1
MALNSSASCSFGRAFGQLPAPPALPPLEARRQPFPEVRLLQNRARAQQDFDKLSSRRCDPFVVVPACLPSMTLALRTEAI